MKIDRRAMVADLPLALADTGREPIDVVSDDDDSAMPAELRSWLVRLRLLEGVPFANLVADSELLPPESIRWFYLDRRWTDALVQGALSVGTVNTDDRTQLGAQYPAIRDELDNEERNVRRPAGSTRFSGGAGPISGFLLRSKAVSGWPGLHVRAFSVDPAGGDSAVVAEDEPGRMRLLRLERLAPAVLLCLFDGIPTVVHVEEPRQGVQFGFDSEATDTGASASFTPRSRESFEYLSGPEIDVPFRSSGAAGVVDIQQIEKRLAERDRTVPADQRTGAVDGFDSAEYALQLVRFPYRQVWGEVDNGPVRLVFKPTIDYALITDTTFRRL